MFLLIYLFCYVNALNTTLEAVIQGVNINQTLGDSKRMFFSNTTDCKKECYSSTSFDCTAIIWNNVTGSCYTFDTVNITEGIIVDDSSYILFIRSNENENISDVETCKFEATESLIDPAPGNISYYASVAQEECETLCSQTQTCDNIISQFEEGTGSCHLYSGKPDDLDDGGFILYTKTCRKSPSNCMYTKWVDWSTCSSNNTQTRTRTVLVQSDVGGVECADYELMEETSCNRKTRSARNSRSIRINESECDYSTWSEWSTCDSQTCLMNRNRTSEKCENDIDQFILILINSNSDIDQFKFDKVCGYSRNLTSIYPDFSAGNIFKNITLNSTETCESYCLRNMEYTQFDSFLAHQNDGLKSSQCILYQYTNNTSTFTNGDLDLYTFSCSSIF